ncbi:GIY-YIG nuclease family protein [Billgrantia gudaonensis]|uniref:Putative endonuclease n=1 Tax=Billgrantia gudaonensis TaxID=376427 RepID=A0A1G8ZFU7_9GAMM|nr:GIY-YIG nuclease family protein [Halomonas gudaonensis]SDK13982.1 putative endonuclease [Halomonas gudaonensis]
MSQAAACWYLYVIETAGGALYTGVTTDVARRLVEHAEGRGAKALRGRGPLTLLHQEAVGGRGEAQRLEAAVKRLSPAAKRAWLARRRLNEA